MKHVYQLPSKEITVIINLYAETTELTMYFTSFSSN